MSLDRIRMLTGDIGVLAGVDPDPDPGGGGDANEAHVYVIAEASSNGDPTVILTTPVVADGDGNLVFSIDTPSGGAAAATLPSATSIAGAFVEWLIRGTDGTPITLNPSDIAKFWLWLQTATGVLPVDTYVAIAITGGGVAGPLTNSGMIFGLQYSATGNKAFFGGNAGAGAGWPAVTVATTEDIHAVGVATGWLKSNSNSAVFRQANGIDADGKESGVSGTTAIPSSGNNFADAPMTHIAIVVGWSGSGGGTSPIVLPVSLRGFAAQLDQLANFEPDLTPPDVLAVSPPRRIVVIGDSNSLGTQIDPTYGGVAVPAGWVVRTGGANVANYPATASPSVGIMGKLIANAITAGASSGTRWLARRGINGADLGFPGSINQQLADLFADVTALGGGDPQLAIWVFGANDAQDTTESGLFFQRYRRAVRIFRRRYPACFLVFVKEAASGGSYPQITAIRAAIDALAVEFDGSVVADGTALPLFDDIHWTPAAQALLADVVMDAVY